MVTGLILVKWSSFTPSPFDVVLFLIHDRPNIISSYEGGEEEDEEEEPVAVVQTASARELTILKSMVLFYQCGYTPPLPCCVNLLSVW